MRLLLTGGAGFIGSNFIIYWLQKYPQDQIINLDALTYAADINNLAEIKNDERYQFVKGDICDYDLVNDLVHNIDLIVHFAAESHVDNSINDSAPFIRTNVMGTQVLLEAAKNNGGIRFHHISTDEVFGSLQINDGKFNESTPYNPRSPYSASKAASDHLVRAFAHTYNLPITISNCSNNYGPNQHPEKFIPRAIINLLNNRPIPVYGTGQNIRDWLYVKDHCRALDLIIHQGKIGETYCIGGNCEKTNTEIAKILLDLTGQDKNLIQYITDRPGHDFRYAIDIAKIQDELGWQPTTNLEEGLKQSINWYKSKKPLEPRG